MQQAAADVRGPRVQKNYLSLYLTPVYMDDDARCIFERDYPATGKRYDVGRSCIRFRTLDDLPLDVVARAVKSTPVRKFIEQVEAARARRSSPLAGGHAMTSRLTAGSCVLGRRSRAISRRGR